MATRIEVLLNEAGIIPTAMDVELGAATERLGVRDLASAQAHVTRAHTMLATLGLAIEGVAQEVLRFPKPPDSPPDSPLENIVTWARRVHPDVEINPYRLSVLAGNRIDYDRVWAEYSVQQAPTPPVKPPSTPPADPGPLPPGVIAFKAGRFQSMDGLFLRSAQALSIVFTTPASGAGLITTVEYRGEQRNREHDISEALGVSSLPGSKSGPATTTQTRVAIGKDAPGHVRLEPARVYYLNVRGAPWQPGDEREEFSAGIGL